MPLAIELAASRLRVIGIEQLADLLKVPRSNWTIVLLAVEQFVLRQINRFLGDNPRLSPILQRLSFGFVQELVKLERGGKRTTFRIPPTLRARV